MSISKSPSVLLEEWTVSISEDSVLKNAEHLSPELSELVTKLLARNNEVRDKHFFIREFNRLIQNMFQGKRLGFPELRLGNKLLTLVDDIDQLDSTQRAELFHLLCGNLGPLLDKCWSLPITIPYLGKGGSYRTKSAHPLDQRIKAELLRETFELNYSLPDVKLSPAWLAAWYSHFNSQLQHSCTAVCYLLSVALSEQSEESEEILEVLISSSKNEHEIGRMGQHVLDILLAANNPKGWEYVKEMLLTAKRQDGLRDAIGSTMPVSHPGALQLLLKTIQSESLLRYSSIAYAIEEILDFGVVVNQTSLGRVRLDAAIEALSHSVDNMVIDSPLSVRAALWAIATEDAEQAINTAKPFLKHADRNIRSCVVDFVVQLKLTQTTDFLLQAIKDDDLSIAAQAGMALCEKFDDNAPVRFNYFSDSDQGFKGSAKVIKKNISDEVYDSIYDLAVNLFNSPEHLKSIKSNDEIFCEPEELFEILLKSDADRSPIPLLQHDKHFDECIYESLSHKLRVRFENDPESRSQFIRLAGSRSDYVSRLALRNLHKVELGDSDLSQLEPYFTRTGAKYRSQLLELFFSLEPKLLLSSIGRLLIGKKGKLQTSGLELAHHLIENNSEAQEVVVLVVEWESKKRSISKDQLPVLESLYEIAESHSLSFTRTEKPKKRQSIKAVTKYIGFTEEQIKVNQILEKVTQNKYHQWQENTVIPETLSKLEQFNRTDVLVCAIAALKKKAYIISSPYSNEELEPRDIYSNIVKLLYPKKQEDTYESFSNKVKHAVQNNLVTEKKLFELAFYSPQWLKHVSAYFGSPGFVEAYIWSVFHTEAGVEKEVIWSLEFEVKSSITGSRGDEKEVLDKTDWSVFDKQWRALIRQRTALTEIENGEYDLHWFQQVNRNVTEEQWEIICQSLKCYFEISHPQVKKVALLVNVLLGKADRDELIAIIKKQNKKEYVISLGLLPLAAGEKEKEDIIIRYEALQHYHAYAKSLSTPSSREGAITAFKNGFNNLAKTAGYRDGVRLEWALETEKTNDLQEPISCTVDEVTVTLELDEFAQPNLQVQRKEKVLKNIPQKLKKEPSFVELVDRSKALKTSASRIKKSLENAMCLNDVFSGLEIQQLHKHLLIKPVIERLVFIKDTLLGTLSAEGKLLVDIQGVEHDIASSDELRIAHPVDFLKSDLWHDWQKDCFLRERIQPFKQIFRELYVPTDAELKTSPYSNRYREHIVKQKQTTALWRQRGWVYDKYSDDFAWKRFPEFGMVASVTMIFDDGGYDLDAEYLEIDAVCFTEIKTNKEVSLSDVSSVLFSEVMRDMDLVVSVAHADDYNPESSTSTIQMRSQLLLETCQLLGLHNVNIQDNYATIQGELTNYRIHLGSAVVQVEPGGSICVIPVKAEYATNLFLPFADEDYRTAELISKVLLFARDKEIKDPSILKQITP